MTVEEYPFKLNIRLTWAAAILGSIIGIKKGLTFIPPFSNRIFALSSVVGKPPLPFPITTPTRSLLNDKSKPESSIAVAAAATANWENLAILRASLGSTYCPASNPVTSPAMSPGKPSVSHKVILLMPERPLDKPPQNSSTVWPRGDITPNPVITTLVLFFAIVFIHLLMSSFSFSFII